MFLLGLCVLFVGLEKKDRCKRKATMLGGGGGSPKREIRTQGSLQLPQSPCLVICVLPAALLKLQARCVILAHLV